MSFNSGVKLETAFLLRPRAGHGTLLSMAAAALRFVGRFTNAHAYVSGRMHA